MGRNKRSPAGLAGMASSEEPLREAAEAEALARVVSYGADRRWLLEKAAKLRQLAKPGGNRPSATPPPRS